MVTTMEPRVRKLFGTDGMRGVAGEPPLDRETVFAFGQALGRWSAGHDSPQVLIGMDTRESGPWLAETLAGGLASEGAQPRFAGLITTPGVAWLTRTGPFAAGVMISASHNPFHDNGLKVFDHSGFKIPDSTEYGIELEIFERLARGVRPLPLALSADPGLDRQYLDFLVSTFPHRLDGLKLVLDCAHGAAVHLAPALFERLGAQAIAMGASPTGRNINDGCGALHVESLRDRVLAENADAGFAFDGDADRCLAVSKSGRVLDGDATLLICARYLRSRNRLGADVVATVMSNLGFELALKNEGIGLSRAAVGDKYVLEEMIRLNAAIGGEQSGHVIFREYATTGDGLMTALRILEAKTESGRPLDDLVAGFDSYPQKLVNVRVKERRPLAELPGVQSEIRAAESQMNGQGRVLVRFSGTEPLARVMVEAANPEHVEHWSARIADAIRAELS